MIALCREAGMGFKNNLKRLRDRRGWTQTQAAAAAGVPLRTYQNWELGSREPRLDALARLARGFDAPADEFLIGVISDEQPRPAGKRK